MTGYAKGTYVSAYTTDMQRCVLQLWAVYDEGYIANLKAGNIKDGGSTQQFHHTMHAYLYRTGHLAAYALTDKELGQVLTRLYNQLINTGLSWFHPDLAAQAHRLIEEGDL